MRKCTICDELLQDDAKRCPYCGCKPDVVEAWSSVAEKRDGVTVIRGAAGAILFALLSRLLYFGVFWLGERAGLSGAIAEFLLAGAGGVATYILVNLGYSLFAKDHDSFASPRISICMIAIVLTIYLTERLHIAYEIARAPERQATIRQIFRAIPELMKRSRTVLRIVFGRYAGAYGCTGVAFFIDLIRWGKKKHTNLNRKAGDNDG